jgi:hypothetical protein
MKTAQLHCSHLPYKRQFCGKASDSSWSRMFTVIFRSHQKEQYLIISLDHFLPSPILLDPPFSISIKQSHDVTREINLQHVTQFIITYLKNSEK